MIPALLYLGPWLPALPDYPIKEITGFAVTQGLAGCLAASWVHYRNNNINMRLAFSLGLATMIGAYLGGFTSQYYSDFLIKLLYAIVLVIILGITVYSPKPQNVSEAGVDAKAEQIQPEEIRITWKLSLVSVLIGYESGILGFGGAVFLVPIMYSILRLPIRLAVGTGAGIVLMTSTTAFIGKWQAGQILMPEALVITLGALGGATVGAKLVPKVSESFIKNVFFTLILLSLVRTLLEILMGS